MPSLKIKRVIGVYKAPKKLTDGEIRLKMREEKLANKRNYSLRAIRKHHQDFNRKIEERSKRTPRRR
jgi:hypothetical protein